jgi:hypothetical protein
MQLEFNSNSIEKKWMQNGGKNIENMFMNMVFKFFLPKKHLFIALYLKMGQTYSNSELFK